MRATVIVQHHRGRGLTFSLCHHYLGRSIVTVPVLHPTTKPKIEQITLPPPPHPGRPTAPPLVQLTTSSLSDCGSCVAGPLLTLLLCVCPLLYRGGVTLVPPLVGADRLTGQMANAGAPDPNAIATAESMRQKLLMAVRAVYRITRRQ